MSQPWYNLAPQARPCQWCQGPIPPVPAFATLTVCSTRCGMQLRRAAAAALEEPDDRAGWFPYFRCEIPRAVYPRPVPREELPELECEIPTLAQVNARIAQRRRRAA